MMRIAWIVVVACACGPTGTECAEPFYGGGGTDEAWRTMVDADGRAALGPEAAVIDTPSADESFSAAPTFSWSSSIAMQGALRKRRATSPLDLLTSWVIPSARAHEPPVTDDVYFVKVMADGQSCPVASALTTELSWPVDDASFAAMKAAGKPLRVEIVSAYLTDNRVTEGPFRSAAVSFTVQ